MAALGVECVEGGEITSTCPPSNVLVIVAADLVAVE
jgi:hypothetical protein